LLFSRVETPRRPVGPGACHRKVFQYPSTAALPIPDRDAAGCGRSFTNPVGRPPAYCHWTRCACLPDGWRGAPHPLALAEALPPRGPRPLCTVVTAIYSLWLMCYGTQSGTSVYGQVSRTVDPADLPEASRRGFPPCGERRGLSQTPWGATRYSAAYGPTSGRRSTGSPCPHSVDPVGRRAKEAGVTTGSPRVPLLRWAHDVAPWRTRGWRPLDAFW